MRQTRQKALLTDAVHSFTTFFTAEDLFEKVKEHNIGIATVYRYLKQASERHEVHAYTCDRKSIYTTERRNHCHFTCTKCGTMTHFHVDNINFVKSKVPGKLCHFQIDVHGVCEDCE